MNLRVQEQFLKKKKYNLKKKLFKFENWGWGITRQLFMRNVKF